MILYKEPIYRKKLNLWLQ